ncbi:MAG: hypothetical protein WAV11_03050 [Minisyncoccia bacterium]
MRKVFFYIAILFVILQFTFGFSINQDFFVNNIFSGVERVYAQNEDTPDIVIPDDIGPDVNEPIVPVDYVPPGTTDPNITDYTQPLTPTAKTDTESGSWSALLDYLAFIASPTRWVQGIFAAFCSFVILPLLSFVLVIVAFLMEIIMNFSINTVGFQSGQPVGDAINFGWGFIRDLLNITLIFMLVWSAIKTIIGENGDLDNKLIGKVIIAGVLVNFSLLFTQIIIDFFNIFAVAIMNSIKDAINLSTASDTMNLGSFIFNKFFQSYLEAWIDLDVKLLIGEEAMFRVYIQIILICVAVYVYYRIAKIFFVRAIVFVFCMITSPIMFFGFIHPKLDKYRQAWWNNIINSSVTAPIFLICVYFVVKLMTSPGFDTLLSGGFTQNVNTSQLGYAENLDIPNMVMIRPVTMVYFFLIFALLYAAVKLTEEYSSSWGNTIWKEGLNYTKKAVGLAVTAAMTVATGGAAVAARGAAVTLSNPALLKAAAGTGSEAIAARAKLAAAKTTYEKPMAGLKNAFAATKNITGRLGIKTDEFKILTPDAYDQMLTKDKKWTPGEEINLPNRLRANLGVDAAKTPEQVNKEREDADKEIKKIVIAQSVKEGEKYVAKNIEESREGASTAANNFKLVEERVKLSAENELEKKLNDLKNNADISALSAEIANENTKIAELKKEIEKLEADNKFMSSPDKAKDILLKNLTLKSIEGSISKKQEIAATHINSAIGADSKYISVNEKGELNASKADYANTVVKDMAKMDAESMTLFNKPWKGVGSLEEDMSKSAVKFDEVRNAAYTEAAKLQSTDVEMAKTIRNKLRVKTKEEKELLSALKEALAEEKKDGKKDEKKSEEKPKEEEKKA